MKISPSSPGPRGHKRPKQTRQQREERRRRAHVLYREASRIRRRLANAVAVNTDGPVLGRHGGVYEMSERFRAISNGGIGVVAAVVKEVGLAGEIDSSLKLWHRTGRTSSRTTFSTSPTTLCAEGLASTASSPAATMRCSSTPSASTACPTRPRPGTSAVASTPRLRGGAR